jgi:hypothetical protein
MTESTEASEAPDWGLVMPFVVVTSTGGPYDDDAFVAGYQCGEIDRALKTIRAAGGSRLDATVRSAVVSQLDLIAMRHGFKLTARPTEVDGWSTAEFALADAT